MVSSYPLPEGFSEFDVFSLGSCLLVEGECFVLEFSQILGGLCLLCVVLTYDRTCRHPVPDSSVKPYCRKRSVVSLFKTRKWPFIKECVQRNESDYSMKCVFFRFKMSQCRIKLRSAHWFPFIASIRLHSGFFSLYFFSFCSATKVCWASF